MAPSPPSRSYSTGLVKVRLLGSGHYGSPAQYANGGPNADSSPKWPNQVNGGDYAPRQASHVAEYRPLRPGCRVFPVLVRPSDGIELEYRLGRDRLWSEEERTSHDSPVLDRRRRAAPAPGRRAAADAGPVRAAPGAGAARRRRS